jgi:mycoredoxin
METQLVTMYTTAWCPDCRRAKAFMKERGVVFREVDIEQDRSAEAIVLEANQGKRKVPTFEIGARYFACSPFDAALLAEKLGVPLNR